MNISILTGRLTKDIELKFTNNNMAYCNFILAVQRDYKNANGEYEADFINCIAWRNLAETISKYVSKGAKIGVKGAIQTRNYEKDGQRIYITEILVDKIEFLENKNFENKQENSNYSNVNDNTQDNSRVFKSSIDLENNEEDLPF